ncbi:Down syndrome cell adhesion molecule-like protein Dscam2 [Ostrinia furnacalis]|uniref:Down syndrome cell adhesion molecule-like protein Dscam2 n=1 Tax=Ostrinia furnacalis TaxID=93504 RepID=UPI00103B6F6D|nr:Down syndrome cell adhesion molecule-like protein Dscam2 [Ostrinia furnacalis]
MGSWLTSALIILFAMGGEGQEHGPVFLLEPPARLVFSNGTGARVSCAAHGSPAPQLAWQQLDGAQLDDVPGLRCRFFGLVYYGGGDEYVYIGFP